LIYLAKTKPKIRKKPLSRFDQAIDKALNYDPKAAKRVK